MKPTIHFLFPFWWQGESATDNPLINSSFFVTFCSLILKKGVYYNPYFTMDNPDTEGGLIFPIIILLQYNIIKTTV